jgi:hypothetical protein
MADAHDDDPGTDLNEEKIAAGVAVLWELADQVPKAFVAERAYLAMASGLRGQHPANTSIGCEGAAGVYECHLPPDVTTRHHPASSRQTYRTVFYFFETGAKIPCLSHLHRRILKNG